jgi:hypothetical protein
VLTDHLVRFISFDKLSAGVPAGGTVLAVFQNFFGSLSLREVV